MIKDNDFEIDDAGNLTLPKVEKPAPESKPRRVFFYIVRIILTGLPFALGLMLWLINPGYIGELFISEPPLIGPIPLGWVVLATIVTLCVTGYILFGLVDKKIRGGARLILHMFIMIFIVFPAIFLTLLAPATFHVVRSTSTQDIPAQTVE